MPESFGNLISRARLGDGDAARDLVELYEPQIRRAIRVRMRDAQLRKIVDSVDICQSVFGNFFVRAASGEYDLQQPEELIALLVVMARNRINDWYRKEKGRNSDRPMAVELPTMFDASDPSPTPSRQFYYSDLLRQVRERLTEEERRVADARSQGASWISIAETDGSSPDAVRMRLRRGLDRVTRELGLEELHSLS